MSDMCWLVDELAPALDYGQRALALAVTLGHVGLQARVQMVLGRVYLMWETMRGPSRAWSGMWRPSRESCSLNALARMAASRSLPEPI